MFNISFLSPNKTCLSQNQKLRLQPVLQVKVHGVGVPLQRTAQPGVLLVLGKRKVPDLLTTSFTY